MKGPSVMHHVPYYIQEWFAHGTLWNHLLEGDTLPTVETKVKGTG